MGLGPIVRFVLRGRVSAGFIRDRMDERVFGLPTAASIYRHTQYSH